MPRPPRDLAPGIQHFGVGAAGPATYFRDDIDRQAWIRLWLSIVREYGWKPLAFCQLDTHWHALAEIPDRSLATGMQALNCRYGKRFNDRHDRVGYLVRDRYWSRRKETVDQVLAAFRYVARNPVEAGLTTRPQDWFWGSYATTIGESEAFPFVDDGQILAEFGSDRIAAVRGLRLYVELD